MFDLTLFQKMSDGLKAPILPTVNEPTLVTKTKSTDIKKDLALENLTAENFS